MLAIDDLHAGYGNLEVLRGVGLRVERGEAVALLGANGAGKSTLANALLGIVTPTAGRISFLGRDITRERTHLRSRRGIALVPEGRQLFPGLTVDENLRMGLYRERGTREKTRRIDEALELFPIIARHRHARTGLLSGGEQQAVAIARALVSHPELLVIDEPSLGLAPIIVADVVAALSELRARGQTILIVEQNAGTAMSIADRGYVLQLGTVVLEGTAAELAGSDGLERAYLGH
jgi:branched-chain amino acid transport system ATP-binding protein